ncbi:hypothetical protein IH982_01465 [Patescibacteria group bacterium]|nr:hypothetical protein [Patescibacteria group bacterium]
MVHRWVFRGLTAIFVVSFVLAVVQGTRPDSEIPVVWLAIIDPSLFGVIAVILAKPRD